MIHIITLSKTNVSSLVCYLSKKKEKRKKKRIWYKQLLIVTLFKEVDNNKTTYVYFI